MEIFNIFMVILLIALTSFFVASEFAIIKVRRTRIDQLVGEGNNNAVAVRKVLSNLDGYLSACQLGITITSLGLGWLGESTIEHILHPLFEKVNLSDTAVTILSVSIAFAIITFLHVVVGELAPKTFAIHKAERLSLLFARPLIFFYKVMFPFIWILNGSARFITKMFGLNPVTEQEISHSEEELRILLSESYESGEINQSEYKYVNNIFEFDDRVAKEIMVPRTEMAVVDIQDSKETLLEIMTKEMFTRYPVIENDKDHIIGMINLKEVLVSIVDQSSTEINLNNYLRPTLKIFESTPIHQLLVKMQRERVYMAILIDEYGGTAGLVTMEDIVEEIVGEIRDEFDEDEVPLIRIVDENKTIINGKVLIEEVNDLFGIDIDDSDVDTIGGWILTEKISVQSGDTFYADEVEFKVIDMDGFHIKMIEVMKKSKSEEINQI